MSMATSDLVPSTQSREDEIFIPRKKFKTSDLPLNAAQRSTIDSLLHTIKKKGEYDALRKKVWSQYAESVSFTANDSHNLLQVAVDANIGSYAG